LLLRQNTSYFQDTLSASLLNHSLAILFFLRTFKTNPTTDEVPVYICITDVSQRAEISAKRSTLPSKWEGDADKVNGTKQDARTLNTYLDTLRAKPNKQFNQLLSGDEPATAELLENAFLDEITREFLIPEELARMVEKPFSIR